MALMLLKNIAREDRFMFSQDIPRVFSNSGDCCIVGCRDPCLYSCTTGDALLCISSLGIKYLWEACFNPDDSCVLLKTCTRIYILCIKTHTILWEEKSTYAKRRYSWPHAAYYFYISDGYLYKCLVQNGNRPSLPTDAFFASLHPKRTVTDYTVNKSNTWIVIAFWDQSISIIDFKRAIPLIEPVITVKALQPLRLSYDGKFLIVGNVLKFSSFQLFVVDTVSNDENVIIHASLIALVLEIDCFELSFDKQNNICFLLKSGFYKVPFSMYAINEARKSRLSEFADENTFVCSVPQEIFCSNRVLFSPTCMTLMKDILLDIRMWRVPSFWTPTTHRFATKLTRECIQALLLCNEREAKSVVSLPHEMLLHVVSYFKA